MVPVVNEVDVIRGQVVDDVHATVRLEEVPIVYVEVVVQAFLGQIELRAKGATATSEASRKGGVFMTLERFLKRRESDSDE